MPTIKYHDFPESPNEIHRSFEIGVAGFDYYIKLTDELRKKEIWFRWCISGGFEHKYPESTRLIAELYRALEKETKDNGD